MEFDLAARVAEFLKELLEQGFSLPLHWAAVANNGAILGGSYVEAASHDGIEARILVEHLPNSVLVFPVNFMFVGSSGEAARLLIDQSGTPMWLH